MQHSLLLSGGLLVAASAAAQSAPQFHPPVRLDAGGKAIEVEAPGFAAPAWHDVDGDGRQDLVVGQFRDGKMKVYSRNEDGTFATGSWLQAEGAVATVPGVW